MKIETKPLPLPTCEENLVCRVDCENGFSIELMTYGAALLSLSVPDKENRSENVLCSYQNSADYVRSSAFLNMTVGPVAGRIAGASFLLGGKPYHTAQNEGRNTLHGGPDNLSHTNWQLAAPTAEAHRATIVMTKFLPDGYGGFPGNRLFTAEFLIEDSRQLTITYQTETDAQTPANLTNHGYFDLSAKFDGSALRQLLSIQAGEVCLNNEENLPTRIAPVAGTPYDLNAPISIAEAAKRPEDEARLVRQRGFDNAFLLQGPGPQITLFDPESQRRLEIETNQAAVVLYCGGWLDAQPDFQGKGRPVSGSGICLETQDIPNSFQLWGQMQTATPEKPCIQKTVYRFS